MKFSCNFWWIATNIGAVSAFTSNLARISHNQLDLSSTREHTMTLSAKRKTPQPPDYEARVDEQLEYDLAESERRVMLYEKEVSMIRQQLGLKQSELLEEQNIFRDEKRSLMEKIAEFTTMLSQRDKELENAMEQQGQNTKEDVAKKAELENTIASLETQLQEKSDSLKNEKESSEELRSRIHKAEDALEFEQMNFEKERNLLQELITNERKEVMELQEKFEENGKSFEITREELLNKIQNEEKKLSDTKAEWKVTQEKLQKVEEKLEASLQEKAQLLKESEIDNAGETNAMSDEIVNLQNQIKEQQAKMEAIKGGVQKENKGFADSRNDLETKIEVEEKMIKDLQEKLGEEQKQYEAEKSSLDQEIKSITANLSNVETQLANERVNFSKEKEMLEKKLANEIRVGRLKKKEMKVRYDTIRSEMTDLWESSKRQARQEENRLRKKYKLKLETVQSQVAKLETDLSAEQKRLLVEQKEMQSRHAEELITRDATILKLEGSVTTLSKLIADKDLIIQEKNERIQQYETSFRKLAKLGFVVTGNKIKRVAGPLKRLVQNSPPTDDL
jgi:chromosome segregation ATPase